MILRLTALVFLITSAGCSDSKSPADPMESCSNVQGSLEVGHLEAGEFVPFAAGDSMPVIHGVQGGTWIMPTVRFTNLDTGGDMQASLALDDGTLLGEIARPGIRAVKMSEAVAVLQYFPVPVSDAPGTPEVSTVDGRSASLRMSYADPCERSATLELSCILAVQPP